MIVAMKSLFNIEGKLDGNSKINFFVGYKK